MASRQSIVQRQASDESVSAPKKPERKFETKGKFTGRTSKTNCKIFQETGAFPLHAVPYRMAEPEVVEDPDPKNRRRRKTSNSNRTTSNSKHNTPKTGTGLDTGPQS